MKVSSLSCRCALFLTLGLSASFAATLVIEPSPLPVTTGNSYTVNVVASGTDLYSYGFDLIFDPALLEAQSVTEGAFLPTGGPTVFFPGMLDNLAGSIVFNAGSLTGAIPGVTGTGVLLSVEFLGLADGVAQFSLANALLLDSLGDEIASVSVPEPGTGWLLAGMLASAVLFRTRRKRRAAPLMAFAGALLSTQASRSADIATAQYDNARTMSNPNEIFLTRANVNGTKFGRLLTRPVDGAIFAQPLYAEDIMVAGKRANVVYVATMHNVVYAFDADNLQAGSPLWTRSLGAYATASGWSTGMGVGGTPVIHRGYGALYVVGTTIEGGRRVFRLHALDLATGATKFGGSVVIAGVVPGTAAEGSGGQVAFQADQQVQRTGLAIAQNSVYVSFSADRDHTPYHGWVFGYHLGTLQPTAIFNTSPNASYIFTAQGGGYAAGIWQSGRAPAVDESGALYLETGNGDYDGRSEFGNSLLKLATSPTGALSLSDWFTPSDWPTLNTYDLDFGSTGPTLLPSTNRVVAGSKTGHFFLLDRGNLGRLQRTPAPAGSQVFLATSGCSSPLVFQGCAQIMGQAFSHKASVPALYTWAVRDRLRAYRFDGSGFSTTPLSTGAAVAPYPGGVLAHSSYGAIEETGLVWALTSDVPDNDFYFGPGFSGAGSLRVFNSSNLAQELWNSNQNFSRDALGNLASFTTPLVANGKVFVPTLSNQLTVYGLLDGPVAGDVNGDSRIDCVDLAILRGVFGLNALHPRFDARADVNRDRVIDVRDLNLVARGIPASTRCR